MVRRLFLTPPTLPEDTVTRCLIIPNDKLWLGIFNAAILLTIKAYNYEQVNDTDLAPDDVAAKCYEIYEAYIREECTVCSCNCPDITYRILADGTIEQSEDGGVTWTPAPNVDPRQTGTLYPPLPLAEGELTRCAASENMVATITGLIDQTADELESAASVAEIVTDLITSVAVFLGAIGVIGGLAGVAIGRIFSFGGTAVRAAFDNDVFDRLKCNFFCNLGDDGVVTTGRLAAMHAQIDVDETGLANMHLHDLLTLFGEVGLTNMGRAGSSTGTGCGDCGCGCTVQQDYEAESDDFSGSPVVANGPFLGRNLIAGSPLTFVIPDRAGRTIASFLVAWSGASGAGGLTLTIGAQDSEESPVTRTGTESPLHTFVPSADDDTVTLSVSGTLAYHINFVQVFYDC